VLRSEDQVFRISPETFDEIDDWIRAAEMAERNVQFGMDAMVMLLARTNQAFAMEMARGPVDPREGMKNAAWKVPVRRITSRYYKGWKVKRLAPGAWMLFNDSREAYYIEFGIHPSSTRSTDKGTTYDARVRRPIQKLSLIKTLRFVDQSQAGERVWETIYGSFRPSSKYRARGSYLTTTRIQSVEGMTNL
jgi:hypothetical protein